MSFIPVMEELKFQQSLLQPLASHGASCIKCLDWSYKLVI